MIADIESVMLACMQRKHPKTKRKYKYSLIIETQYSPKNKRLYKCNTIIKSHIELIPDEITGKRKRKRVKDDAVRGSLTSLMLYMVEELKGYDG
ncbi:MAG: hypothetical protein ACI35S_05325 [Anaeroplasma sp.]